MKTLKTALLLTAGLFLSTATFAQDRQLNDFTKSTSLLTNPPAPALGSSYSTAIGLRGGETSGLTIKHFIGGQTAIEGILGFWHHGLHATVLIEYYANAFGASGLNWYYGGGGHFAIDGGRSYYGYGQKRKDYYDDGNFGLGVDGIVGLEYKITNIPIAISLDLKPYVEVISNGRIWGSIDPGLGVKFAF